MAPHSLNNETFSKMESTEKPLPKKPISVKESVLPVKLCGVCGDKALGYNFNAITCESCKAFFRRNALVSKEFRCPFSEQCEITTVTRRFCQKCRLEKCFAIGMVKDYIMSEEDKAQKRQKIAENRAKKRKGVNTGEDDVSSSKLIKREMVESSNNDYVESDSSPVGSTFEGNLDSSSPTMRTDGYDLSYPGNQTVSVIKNNNISDSHPDSMTPCDTSQYSIYNKPRPETYPMTSYNEANGGYVPTVRVDDDDTARMVNSEPCSSKSIDDHVMIRSMLITSTPNGESVKLSSFAMSNDQPICEAAQSSKTQNSYPRTPKVDVAKDVLQEVERTPIQPNSIESILCEAIKLEFEAYSSLAQINSSSRELNDAERAKLNELIVANKALLAPLDDDMASLMSDECRMKVNEGTSGQYDPRLVGIINLTAVAIRRLIKMSKKINAFKNMCEQDQVALLKGGCTEMMILRSTMTYDCARDTWKVPHSQEALSNIKADILKLAKGNIYEEHDRFIRTFDHRWRTDENIILIMSAIVLFTPDRPRVIHSDVIKLEQNSYYYLLRRYLESIYPGCEAKSTFLKLIQKIMELHKLSEEVIGVYLNVNPSQVEPLLIEIFDLKH